MINPGNLAGNVKPLLALRIDQPESHVHRVVVKQLLLSPATVHENFALSDVSMVVRQSGATEVFD